MARRWPRDTLCAALGLTAVACSQATSLPQQPSTLGGLEVGGADASDVGSLAPISREQLCVTNGNVDTTSATWRVRSPTMRAVVTGRHAGDHEELTFRYHGPTAETVPLGSGEVRHQVGIKLRARDTCNVIYAMWRVDVGGPVRVSVKHNAGMTRHEECRDRGYANASATFERPLPVAMPGERHTMIAVLSGGVLEVTVDGVLAWRGPLPAQAATFDGPAGVRSDNVAVDLELRLAPRAGGSEAPTTDRCRR